MISLKKSVIGIFLIILTLHILASVNHWYWTYRWIDMPMHFLGGLLVAMIFFWLIWPKLQITNGKALIAIVLVVSFVVFIGVLWEFFEFLYDVFISTKGYALLQIAQQGVSDTMSDLFFDLFGGLAFSLGYKINQKLNLKNQNIKN